MKVLLINPLTKNVTYGKYAELGGKNAPLSLCYLAAVLREEIKDINVKILDSDILNLQHEDVLKYINSYEPEIIGITGVTSTFYLTKELAELIKKRFPNIKIVIGGPHASALPVETMESKCFDYLVYGEGEYTFLDFVKGKPLSKIKGIIYRNKGKIKVNPPRELIKDIDTLPYPAIALLPNVGAYHPQAVSYRRKPCFSMITTRGCPYHCQFCDHSVFGFKYRAHSPERIFEEIKNLVKNYGVREIKFLDDNFCLDNKRIEKICDLLIEADFDLIWVCSGRVDMDLNLLEKMKKAGCWQICVGIESGNQKVLDFIHKNIKLERVREFVNKAHKIGIKVRGFFILGHPIDTKKIIEQTINFALSLPLYTAEFALATPFPNTELSQIAEKYGKVSGNLNDYSTITPSFVPKGLTSQYLIRKQKQGHKRFYLRLPKVLEFLMEIRGIDDIRKYWAALKVLS